MFVFGLVVEVVLADLLEGGLGCVEELLVICGLGQWVGEMCELVVSVEVEAGFGECEAGVG